MSVANDDHSIAKIRTFKADVERARSEGDTAPAPEEVTKEKSLPKIAHTPAATMDAHKEGGVRDARTYLSVSDEQEQTQVTPVMSTPVDEPTMKTVAETEVDAVEEKPKPKLPIPAAIPTVAPDLLSAEIATLSAKTKKPSLLSDNEKVFETDDFDGLETGTIIQDKKRKRGLTAVFGTLFSQLFANAAGALKRAPKETVIVPKEHEAPETAQTVSAPKDDFVEVVRERVRAAKVGAAPVTVLEPSKDDGSVGWTHVVSGDRAQKLTLENEATAPKAPLPLEPLAVKTETTALSGGPMWQAPRTSGSRVAVSKPVPSTHTNTPQGRIPVSSVVLTHRKTADILKPVEATLPAPEPIEVPEPVVETVPPPPAATPITHAEPAKEPVETSHEVREPVAVAKQDARTAEGYIYDVDKTLVEEPEEHEEPATAPSPQAPLPGPLSPSGFRRLEIREGLKAAKNAPTNSLALVIMIIIAAISLGVFVSIQLLSTTIAPNTSISIAQPPATIVVGKQLPLALTSDRSDLLNGIRSLLEQESETVQVYPTALSANGREGAANAATILAVFDPRIEGSFERAVTEVTFGGTGTAEPFLILKTTEFDTAFAGMLSWENSMSADLAPLFGEPVTESLDPQARTASGIRSAFFVDGIIANRSARILYDKLGLERLVYVFIDQHTILITTNRTAVERLVPLIR